MGRGNLGNTAKHPDDRGHRRLRRPGRRMHATVAAYKESAKGYADYRDVLSNRDLDAVIIATPPHWHALQAIEACKAGKDIYLQKPMTLHLGESLAVLETPSKNTTASARSAPRSTPAENYRRVVEIIQAGNLGPVSVARTFNVMNQGPNGVGKDPNTTVPQRRRLGALDRPRPDAALQFDPGGQGFLHPLFLHGLQRRLDARHGPAHHRSADLGLGPGLSHGR